MESPESITKPFIAFLRECVGRPGAQYLTFDGKAYAVVIFTDDEHATRYRDGMSEGGAPWTFAGIKVDA